MSEDGDVLRPDDFNVRAKLVELRQLHRDLDQSIEALSQAAVPDILQLQRLKKRKLALKDRIAALEEERRPDIIA